MQIRIRGRICIRHSTDLRGGQYATHCSHDQVLPQLACVVARQGVCDPCHFFFGQPVNARGRACGCESCAAIFVMHILIILARLVTPTHQRGLTAEAPDLHGVKLLRGSDRV